MTIGEAEKLYITTLTSIYDESEAKSLAWWSINDVCKISRTSFLASKEKVISEQQEASLQHILEELKTGKPIQYVLGETEFYGLPFKVNPSVLIPRPETEELVDWILIEIRNSDLLNDINGNILDIGTGSGCIPIAIKKFLPEFNISALDVSKGAIETAKINAELNQTEIEFIEDDILNPSQLFLLNKQYTIIISNPPYVRESEKTAMHNNVLGHEPHLALFVADEDALIFYSRIADFAKTNLVKGGMLFLEINENLAPKTIDLLEGKGLRNIELRQDIRGKNRMIKATL